MIASPAVSRRLPGHATDFAPPIFVQEPGEGGAIEVADGDDDVITSTFLGETAEAMVVSIDNPCIDIPRLEFVEGAATIPSKDRTPAPVGADLARVRLFIQSDGQPVDEDYLDLVQDDSNLMSIQQTLLDHWREHHRATIKSWTELTLKAVSRETASKAMQEIEDVERIGLDCETTWIEARNRMLAQPSAQPLRNTSDRTAR